MKYILMILVGFMFIGCANKLTPEMIRNADYGIPPSEDYAERIRKHFNNRLIDPTSALYQIGQPSKGYIKNSLIYGTKQTFGWKVCGTINSKNRMGGYAGQAPFFVLFKNDNINVAFLGKSGNSSGDRIVNDNFRRACTR